MRRNFIVQILIAAGLIILAALVVVYFFIQENKTLSVSEEGPANGLIINEVMSANSGFLPDEEGEFPDWIELYNPTNEAINIYGFGLSDDETEPIKYALPDITINPGEYLVVFASGKGKSTVDSPYQHTNFKLSSKGDIIILSGRSGATLDRIDLDAIPTNISYGRNPNNSELLERFENPTPGFENSEAGLLAYKESRVVENPELIITEVMTSNQTMVQDSTGDYPDWIELYNNGNSTINLNDYYLSDDLTDPLSFRMPDVNLKAGEYYLVYASGDIARNQDVKDSVHVDFKLSSYEESIVVSSLTGMTLDTVSVKELGSDYAYARILETAGYRNEWQSTAQPSPGYENTEDGYLRFMEDNAVLIGDIIINEVVFSNDAYAVESNGEFYDWIEILNRGTTTVNLKGYGLTDNTGNPGKWRFPDVEIRAGEFLLVQASGEGKSGKTAADIKKKYLNTNFTLSLDGEIIALYDDSDQMIDRYNVNAMQANVSIGRQGGDDILVFPIPTPGVMNTGGVVGYTEAPSFTVAPGVYDISQTITVNVPRGSVCYYTLDGSTPTNDSFIYENGILIDQTTNIRLMAQKSGYMPSSIVTGTYLIGVDHTLDIISITTDSENLWGDDGIYDLGDGVDVNDERLAGTRWIDMGDGIRVFDYSTADDGDPTTDDLAAARLAITNANFRIRDYEVPANFSFYVEGEQVFSQDVGIQLSGDYSRNEPQKSFAIYSRGKYGNTTMEYSFFDNRDFTEYKMLVARQSGNDCKYSRLRDIFMTSIMEKYSDDIQVQSFRQCVLYLNGKYWGIYNLREKSNKYYAAARYNAPSPEDNIDFLKGNGEILVGSNADYKALEKFMDENDIGIAEKYEYVKSQMDVYNFMDYIIAEDYFVNADDGNRKFYRVNSDDGKWRWILYDMDNAMVVFPYEVSRERYEWNYIEEITAPGGTGAGSMFSTSIIRGLLENEEWKREFLERYAYHLKNTFNPDTAVPYLQELASNIASEIEHESDTFNWVAATFQNQVDGMVEFLEERPTYAKAALQETLEISDSDMTEIFGE